MTIFPELTDDRAAGRLTTTLGDGVALDTVTWGMLTHNAVPGVATVRRTQLDDRVVLAFEAPGEPLARRMEAPLRKDQVLQLLDSMVDAVLAADRHMIPLAALVYDPERVFVDATGAVTMICVPVEGADHGDPVAFFKRVIFNLRYAPQDDTSYVSDLINVLGGSTPGDVSKLSRLLRATRVSDAAGRGAPGTAPAPVQGVAAPGVAAPATAAPWGETAPLPEWGVPMAVAGVAARTAGPGFAVPGGTAVPVGRPTPATRAAVPTEDEDGEEVSLAYLLQHYSKENKERYDRGRKARAAAKAAARTAAGAAPEGAPAAAVTPGPPAPPLPGDVGVPPHAPYPVVPPVPPAPAGAAPYPGPPAPGIPAVPGYPVAVDVVAPSAPPGYPRHSGAPGDPGAAARFGLQDMTTGATTWLTKPITVVGRRRARVDIAVADGTVSKNHAIVQVDGETCSIIDNASTNGVEVDGVRIAPLEATTLSPGSRISVGDVVLVLVDRAAW